MWKGGMQIKRHSGVVFLCLSSPEKTFEHALFNHPLHLPHVHAHVMDEIRWNAQDNADVKVNLPIFF